VRRFLCQAAWAASRSRKTYLAAQFRRFSARIGRKRALIAVAHSILTIAYHLLRNKQSYKSSARTISTGLMPSHCRTAWSNNWSALATLSHFSPKEPQSELISKEYLPWVDLMCILLSKRMTCSHALRSPSK